MEKDYQNCHRKWMRNLGKVLCQSAFNYCKKMSKIINLKREKLYFVS